MKDLYRGKRRMDRFIRELKTARVSRSNRRRVLFDDDGHAVKSVAKARQEAWSQGIYIAPWHQHLHTEKMFAINARSERNNRKHRSRLRQQRQREQAHGSTIEVAA